MQAGHVATGDDPILGASLLVGVGDLAAFRARATSPWPPEWCPSERLRTRRRRLHNPRRYHRALRRVFDLSAQTSMIRPDPTRDY
jgi:hypothetical protein